MNGFLMLEVTRQRAAEQHEAARHASRVRALRKAIRAQRHHAAADAFDLPPIPDYVDGTFRRPEDEAAAERTGAAR